MSVIHCIVNNGISSVYTFKCHLSDGCCYVTKLKLEVPNMSVYVVHLHTPSDLHGQWNLVSRRTLCDKIL